MWPQLTDKEKSLCVEKKEIAIWNFVHKKLSGKDGATKSDEFSDEFQTAFHLRPSSSENYVAIFLSDPSPIIGYACH